MNCLASFLRLSEAKFTLLLRAFHLLQAKPTSAQSPASHITYHIGGLPRPRASHHTGVRGHAIGAAASPSRMMRAGLPVMMAG